jgi:hypothetical protein
MKKEKIAKSVDADDYRESLLPELSLTTKATSGLFILFFGGVLTLGIKSSFDSSNQNRIYNNLAKDQERCKESLGAKAIISSFLDKNNRSVLVLRGSNTGATYQAVCRVGENDIQGVVVFP